jgi:allantoinase
VDRPDFVVRGRRVVTPSATGPASVHVRDGRIAAVEAFDDVPVDCPIVDVADATVMPGLVDIHVHVNQPGRTEWEGFETATRAAAAGGVTTLVDMPLNSIPPTTSVEGFRAKLEAATGACWVDVGFWGGVVPGNTSELRPLVGAGVFGFKCFLVPSGVEEFPHVGEAELREAMPELAQLDAVLLAHAEVPGPIEEALREETASPSSAYGRYLASRPRAAENEAIASLVDLSRETGAQVHIVHLSSSDAIPMLRRAREEGVRISAETCSHYLYFAAEEIPDGATQFKCAPPIRERENRERLWAGLEEGVIDLVISDHSPCSPELKHLESGNFEEAWGGISSLQLGLSVLWTEASRRGHSIRDLARWMCEAPARRAGLGGRKGAIAAGHDADFVVWNPDATFRVEPSSLHHRHKLTPYAGHMLRGVVEATYLRGEKVYDRGRFGPGPRGRVLRSGELRVESGEHSDLPTLDERQ